MQALCVASLSWRSTPRVLQRAATSSGARPVIRHSLPLVATSAADELLGTVSVKQVAPTVAEIGMLSVDPDRQSQGVGGRLLDAGKNEIPYFEQAVREGCLSCEGDRKVAFGLLVQFGSGSVAGSQLCQRRILHDLTPLFGTTV